MAVQYDSKNDQIHWNWGKRNPRTEITQEEINWWDSKPNNGNDIIQKIADDVKDKSKEDVEEYIKKLKIPTDELKEFVTNADNAGKSMEDFKESLANAVNEGVDFGGILKNLGASLASAGINMLIGIGIDLLIKGIDKAIHYSEDLRKASTELTNQYKDEKESLDDNRQSYEELAKKMQNANLTTDEVKSNKEELSKIQQDLIDKFGLEAEGIDLVNGKYDEQIKKLDQIERQKAKDYVAENDGNIAADRKKVENEKRITSRSVRYNEFTTNLLRDALPTAEVKQGNGSPYFTLKGNIGDLHNELVNAYSKIVSEKGKNSETEDALDIINQLIDKLKYDDYEQSLKNLKEYSKAAVLSNDNYYDTYTDLQNAINDYNTALQSGENVDQAFDNLTRIQNEVTEITQSTDDAKYAFDDLLDSIDRGRETD